jgi:hypothetical protein
VRVSNVHEVTGAREKFAKAVQLSLSVSDWQDGLWDRLRQVLEQHPGGAPVYLQLSSGRLRLKSRVSPKIRVAIGEALRSEVEALLGAGHILYLMETNGSNGRARGNGRGAGRR